MSERLLTRTHGGEKAWRSLPLPPAERRMLGLVRAPLPEHAVRVLIGQDPLLSVMLGRGWLKWEEERKDDTFPLPHTLPNPSSQEGSEALKRIHERMEEKRRLEEEFLEQQKQENVEQENTSSDQATPPQQAELDTYSTFSPDNKEEDVLQVPPSPFSLKVQQWIEEEPSSVPSSQKKDQEKEPTSSSTSSHTLTEVSEKEKEESLRRFMDMMSLSPNKK